MAGRKVNITATLEVIKKELVNGRSVTINAKHADWIIKGLEKQKILLEISDDKGVWKIKRRKQTLEDIKLDIPYDEIRRYCMDRGTVIYPRPISTLEYELVIERQGMVDTDEGTWRQAPKPNEGKWYDRIRILYKQEYIKLLSNGC